MLVENDREDKKIWKRLCVKQEDTFSLGGRNGRAREDLVVGLENINYGRRTRQEQSQEQRRGRGLLGRETKPSASFRQNREDEKKLSKGWRKRRRNYLNSFDGIIRKLGTPLISKKKALHSGQFILIKTKLQCSFFVVTKRFYTACHDQGE